MAKGLLFTLNCRWNLPEFWRPRPLSAPLKRARALARCQEIPLQATELVGWVLGLRKRLQLVSRDVQNSFTSCNTSRRGEKCYHRMFPSARLLQHACRITLFTRPNCSLCTKAKQTLSSVWDVRPFEFKEIDVMRPEEKSWRDLYEFDTPVVSPKVFTVQWSFKC